MFKFNFGVDSPQFESAAVICDPAQHAEDIPGASYDVPAIEEELNEKAQAGHSVRVEMLTVRPGITLQKGIVSNTQAADALGSEEVAVNDLIPGCYEGGFKQWEGGLDLATYLAEHAQQLLPAGCGTCPGGASSSSSGSTAGGGCRVLELGCGHGLPGLVALHHGAEVHFQDYNSQVLHMLTMPNAVANWRAWSGRRDLPPSAARFFSGSWDGLGSLLEARELAGSYDLILTAETIYSPEATRSLFACIKRCLRRPGGVALVAAKAYYFGCGGSAALFLQMVEADGTFNASTVWSVDDGRSNTRSIIQLTFR